MRPELILKEALVGLGRNLTMTVALIITTAISIALLTTGLSVSNMAGRTKEIYLDRVEIMVQLDEDLSAHDPQCASEKCQKIAQALEQNSAVEAVTFRNREQSYQRFVEVFQSTDPVLVEQTSPDALPAAFHVRLSNPLDSQVLDPVRALPGVDAVVDQVDDLKEATDNLDAITAATFILAGLQLIASLFLIANMVQIAAFARRQEMSVMRMVGASRWFTNAPFALEAMLATAVGAAVALGGLLLGKQLVLDKALRGLYEAHLLAPLETQHILGVLPGVTVAALALSALTAVATVRLYVRT